MPKEGWIAVWFMRGNQVVSTSYLSINRVADPDWQIVGAGDPNDDRATDVVWQHRTQRWLAVWYLNGAQVLGTQRLSIPQMPDPRWHIRGVGDSNGDGRADLLWWNDTSGDLGVLQRPVLPPGAIVPPHPVAFLVLTRSRPARASGIRTRRRRAHCAKMVQAAGLLVYPPQHPLQR